jgi:phosphohistidine phosphatase
VSLLLDLLRHGLCAPFHEGDDASRELVPEGESAIERLASSLAAERERPDRVFASPMLRARQTASIVSRILRLTVPIEELIELEPERDPAGVLPALAAHGVASGHVLVVSHQPLVGRMVAELTGSTDVRVSPGTLVRISIPDWPASPSGRIVFTRNAGR